MREKVIWTQVYFGLIWRLCIETVKNYKDFAQKIPALAGGFEIGHTNFTAT